jgi:hypothetical protein
MPQNKSVHFFLGANTAGGFYSLYDKLLAPEEADRIYILKGGPGSGKIVPAEANRRKPGGTGGGNRIHTLLGRPGIRWTRSIFRNGKSRFWTERRPTCLSRPFPA